MQTPSILFTSILVVACTSDSPPLPTTIAIQTTEPAALVAVRDWTGDWRRARSTSRTTFAADVTGAYLVAVVCQELEGVIMWQVAQTLADGQTLALSCGYPEPLQHAVSFQMVQPGFVTLGNSLNLSSRGDWEVLLSAPTGAHDVIALGSDHVAVRPVVIDRDVVLPTLDLAVEGIPLVASPVTATNATASESLSAVLRLSARPADISAQHSKPLDALKITPPEAQLLQTVTVVAKEGQRQRQVRRLFQLGDNTAFVLPASLGPLDWSFDADAVTVAWTSLPEHEWIRVDANSAYDGPFSSYTLSASASFVAETGITRVTIETDIPGFKKEWILDGTQAHLRSFRTSRSLVTGDEMSLFSELDL
ncbi:MAG: hypothetical protein H0T65_23895 [Deltaproteobacteria bacterium]|nr:hypothetical protein [Deltaproteobacteria bacterium]